LNDALSGTSKAQCCWALANNYIVAADLLLKRPTPQTSVPALFLLAHALELHLKAFLMAKGISESRLRSRDIGHNLVACFRESREQGLLRILSLTKKEVCQIIRINRYYRGKQLEYFAPTAKRFGSIDEFQATVEKISRAVSAPITFDDFRELSSEATRRQGNRIGDHF